MAVSYCTRCKFCARYRKRAGQEQCDREGFHHFKGGELKVIPITYRIKRRSSKARTMCGWFKEKGGPQ